MGSAAWLLGIWLQVVEVWPSGIRAVTYPDLEGQGARTSLFVAWSHPTEAWEVGDFFLSLVYAPRYPSNRTQRLRQWADSLGLTFSTWSGPEGAALIVEVPRSGKVEAMQWLYAAMGSLELGDEHLYRWAIHSYRRRGEGLQLGRDIALRRKGWSGKPPSYEALKAYFYTYLRPERLWAGVFGRLLLREKAEWRRLWAFWKVPSGEATTRDTSDGYFTFADTVEENVWAYLIYGAACLETPEGWPARLAFVEAFLTRWQTIAPPLQFQGAFEGNHRYCFEVRLDGKGYDYLRGLSHLHATDSAEARSWASAYACRRIKLRGEPGRYPDVWIGALLRGDSVSLPDTLPDTLWWHGWPITLRGIWLMQELSTWDSLPEENTQHAVLPLSADTFQKPPLFETLWIPPRRRSEPPLSMWAAAIQLNLATQPHLRWTMIGYYGNRKDQRAAFRRLHAWRRILIQQYRVPPQALEVQVRPAYPDLSPRAVRIVCVNSS